MLSKLLHFTANTTFLLQRTSVASVYKHLSIQAFCPRKTTLHSVQGKQLFSKSIMDVKSMKVVELREFLRSKGATTTGNKDALLKRALALSVSKRVDRNENNTEKTPPTIVKTPEVDEEALKVETSDNGEENKAQEVDFTSDDVEENMLKRKSDSEDPSPKRKKTRGPPMPKNPVMILNEFQPGTTYTLVGSSGLPHNSMFTMQVMFKGEKYTGSAPSKKLAKQQAAAAALRGAVQFPDPHKVSQYVMAVDRRSIDFTSDDVISDEVYSLPALTSQSNRDECDSEDVEMEENVAAQPKPAKRCIITADKNPVMLLHELYPGLKYECVEETGVNQSKVFTMQVVVNGNVYQGYGKSKKQGKVGAALNALREERQISLTPPDQASVPSNSSEEEAGIQISGKLPDLVNKLIREKFGTLTNNFTSEHSRHKVLAGIVMTRGADCDVTEGEVISVATGTKCVSGEYISDQGTALFDCHAEIVSRRGLRRFLYKQLLAFSKGELTILEPCVDGGFRVKPEISFHLFINTSPCGDSRIFSPHESAAGTDDGHPNRRSRGLLRTKIENGEGTIPVETGSYVQERGQGNVQQAWDGIISGERLLTMSCSDKLAKWNILGLQGSLLSLYMEPVYLTSIILGSLYHAKHLERGVFTRAKDAIDASAEGLAEHPVKPPYRVHRPLLAAVPNPEKRVAKKAPTFCLHWSIGEDGAQIINTASGRALDGASSNLCKAEMLRLFSQVATKTALNPKTNIADVNRMTYAQLKGLSKEYQHLKYLLMTGFHKVGCGAWVGKPSEVDGFTAADLSSA